MPRFSQFLAEIAPNALELLEKSDAQVVMPHGGYGHFIPADVIPDFILRVLLFTGGTGTVQ